MPPRSKIATLPEHLRQWLRKAIVERGHGDIVAHHHYYSDSDGGP